ncbi:WD40 repeat-containing protein [Xenococcus sp. PCC 7305]|uniref:trypsin-like peptidase domain-containing protein n=1 Tax=Xenococcus sp. PCC 7305 TaxID=102125 RepID=UPI0002ACD269|nr:trypsin-like peptidase domain-containing protein [Xenococcus sp. PCC 7305]ELS00388.1 WD40 repeat-containing protein [Xenococcus sp. PCC 7305]
MTNQKALIPLTGLSFVVGLIVLSSPSPIANQAEKFTVQVNGENTGSGTIIDLDREQGKYTVLTSWHVVKYPGEYSITTFDGKKHKVKSSTIKNLPNIDLALIEFEGKSKNKQPYKVAEFGDSKNITSGVPLYLSGYLNPAGRRPRRNYVLQPARTLSLQSLAEEGYRIVHDRRLIPGTSGGPIVDRQANLVGVNGIRTKEGTNDLSLGIGIPIQIYQASQDRFVSVEQATEPEQSDTPQNTENLALSSIADLKTKPAKTKYESVYTSPAGHFGDVKTVAMQGDIIVTGSEDTTIKIWDRSSRTLKTTLIGHTAPISGVVITKNNTVISSSQDGTIRFWDLSTGEEERESKNHQSPVDAIALSKDESLLISGDGDGNVKIWDLQDPSAEQPIETKQVHKARIYDLAITANNQIIVSGSEDKTIKLWNRSTEKDPRILIDTRLSRRLTRQAIRRQARKRTGKETKPFKVSHEASVDRLVISNGNKEDKTFIISGSSDNLIKVWDLETGELIRTLKGHSSSVRDLAVTGNTLVSADNNNETIKVWNFLTGNLKHSFKSNHYFWFSSIAISEDGSTLVSASQDEAIKIRNLKTGRLETIRDSITGKKEHPLSANSHSIRTVAISDHHIFSADRDNTITVKNLATGALEYSLEGHKNYVNSLAVNGNVLVSGSKDRTIRIWNLQTWELEKTIRNLLDPITRSIAISEDGSKLVTGSYKAIKIWDLPTGKLEQFLEAHNDGVNAIAIQGNTIVSGGGDKRIKIIDLATGELKHSLPLDKDQEQGHKASINSIVIYENKIYSASYDKTIKVWDLTTGELKQTLTDHQAAVNALAISGNILVSGSRDGEIETRNLTTGKLENIIQAHPTSVNTVAMSEGIIVSGSSDNTIKIWRIPDENNSATNPEAQQTSTATNK